MSALATRQAFGDALARLGESHPEIVVLDADLSKSTKSDLFAKRFPERFFEMGIAEANMIGTAAGLAFAGKTPFLCSFGCFLTGRYDTIRLSVAYSQAPVRLVGTHAGVGIGDDGHSQMGLEDVALMRSLPQMRVFQPMDAYSTTRIMEHLVEQAIGPAYLRLTRQALPDLWSGRPGDAAFEIGRLQEIRAGTHPVSRPKVALIGSGAATAECVRAYERLSAEPIDVSVWDAHCLKPFDARTLQRIASQNDWIVSVEDHSVIGGLGSCVEEVVAASPLRARVHKLGVQDLFGQSGDPAELYDLYGISAERIAETVGKLARDAKPRSA